MKRRGSVYKRCGCRTTDGRQLADYCEHPDDPNHGSWTLCVDLPPREGKRRQMRKGGFESSTAAELALRVVLRRMTPTPTAPLALDLTETRLLGTAARIYRDMWGREDDDDRILGGLIASLDQIEKALLLEQPDANAEDSSALRRGPEPG